MYIAQCFNIRHYFTKNLKVKTFLNSNFVQYQRFEEKLEDLANISI